MEKITVFYLITGLHPGGAENVVYKLVTASKKTQPVVCSIIPGGAIAQKLQAAGIPVYDLGVTSPLQSVHAYVRLRKILKKYKPQILHCFLFHANLLGRIAAWGMSLKKISSIRVKLNGFRYEHVLDFLSHRLVDYYTVNSHALQKYVVRYGIPAKKVALIENGIAVTPLRKKKHALLTITSVAHLRKQKDYPTLLRALAIIQKTHSCRLLIAGSWTSYENELDKLKKMVKELKLKHVHFLGYCKNVPAVFAETDIYASATLYEGQSNSLLEAMAAKLPIVTTNIPENSEVVRNGKEALLVPCSTPAAMATALLKMINDKQLRDRLARNAYRRVHEKYSFATTLKKTEDLYYKLTKQ